MNDGGLKKNDNLDELKNSVKESLKKFDEGLNNLKNIVDEVVNIDIPSEYKEKLTKNTSIALIKMFKEISKDLWSIFLNKIYEDCDQNKITLTEDLIIYFGFNELCTNIILTQLVDEDFIVIKSKNIIEITTKGIKKVKEKVS
jgi:hypothetical protein